jgi:deoxyribodipyrimidine photo-lyase
MFNPYTQAEKFDKGAAYIQEWVPELRDVDPGRLTSGDADDFPDAANYPAPLVDHNSAYHRARQVFEEAQEQASGRYDVPA